MLFSKPRHILLVKDTKIFIRLLFSIHCEGQRCIQRLNEQVTGLGSRQAALGLKFKKNQCRTWTSFEWKTKIDWGHYIWKRSIETRTLKKWKNEGIWKVNWQNEQKLNEKNFVKL